MLDVCFGNLSQIAIDESSLLFCRLIKGMWDFFFIFNQTRERLGQIGVFHYGDKRIFSFRFILKNSPPLLTLSPFTTTHIFSLFLSDGDFHFIICGRNEKEGPIRHKPKKNKCLHKNSITNTLLWRGLSYPNRWCFWGLKIS